MSHRKGVGTAETAAGTNAGTGVLAISNPRASSDSFSMRHGRRTDNCDVSVVCRARVVMSRDANNKPAAVRKSLGIFGCNRLPSAGLTFDSFGHKPVDNIRRSPIAALVLQDVAKIRHVHQLSDSPDEIVTLERTNALRALCGPFNCSGNLH